MIPPFWIEAGQILSKVAESVKHPLLYLEASAAW
jgi:hypothetical protein